MSPGLLPPKDYFLTYLAVQSFDYDRSCEGYYRNVSYSLIRYLLVYFIYTSVLSITVCFLKESFNSDGQQIY